MRWGYPVLAIHIDFIDSFIDLVNLSKQISAWMNQMERENPDVVSSMIYGQTYENRNITLLKVLTV